jgi:hypothetical protein
MTLYVYRLAFASASSRRSEPADRGRLPRRRLTRFTSVELTLSSTEFRGVGELRVRYADVELGFIDKSGYLRRRKLAQAQACGLVDNAEALPTTPQEEQQQQPAA